MLRKVGCNLKKGVYVLGLFIVGMFTACGREQDMDKAVDDTDSRMEEFLSSENDITEATQTDDRKIQFGENCIAEQTFEVELSEYSGKVYFVPFAPSEDNQGFCMQIIQDGEVLTDIHTYVPMELAEETFSSLDAVSFYDVNYDGYTDIVLIETYGQTSFAAIYYGFDADGYDYERYFIAQEELSEAVSNQVEVLSIPEIRSFLADGKKNGEFTSYQGA